MTTTPLLLQTLEDLKNLPQWVCFSPDKEPYNARTGGHAQANNPSTWSTYQQAGNAWKQNTHKYAGIGFELLAEQALTVVDLDKCINDQGKLTPWSRAIVDRLDSYTEISPSGHGVHIWVQGSIPKKLAPDTSTPDRIEMDDCKKYYTVTGNQLPGTPNRFEDRQEALLCLYNEVTESRAAAKKEAKKAAQAAKKTPSNISPDGNTKYALAALEAECSTLGSTGDGGRNSQLFKSAAALGELVAGGELQESLVIDRLTTSAERAGLDGSETEKTLQSGLAAGKEKPRNTPKKNTDQGQAPIKKTAQTATSGQTSLPEIIIGSQLRETRREALAALMLAQEQEHTIFVYAQRLVKVCRDKKNDPIIFPLAVPELKNILSDCADFYRAKKGKKDETILLHISPPKEIAEAILAMIPGDWPFPVLRAIVEMPVLRPDGSVLDTPGYDESTSLFYMGNDQMRGCKIPANPTRTDIEKACSAIETCIGEFPYEMEADHANAYGLLLTLATRYIYSGDVQIGLINAVKPGTGKGLLTHALSAIATGRTAPITSFPNKEEETKKVIDAQVLAGVPLLMFDNIKRTFTSAALDALATCTGRWTVRPLGQSKNITVDVSMTVVASGNNIQLDTDMARRCFQIRLISSVSSPDERDDFKIKNLIEYTLEHRAELVCALLTLARAWYVAGKPGATNKLARSSTFKHWANTVGGILEYAGIQGFLENRDALKADSNEEENQTYTFLCTWSSHFSSTWISSKKLVETIQAEILAGSADGLPADSLAENLPDELKEMLQNPKKNLSIGLGKWLVKRVKTPYGPDNIRIEREEDKHTKVKTWRVVRVVAGRSFTDTQAEKLSLLNEIEQIEKNNNIYAQSDFDDITTRTTRKTSQEDFTDIFSKGSASGLKPLFENKKSAGSPDTLPAKKACPEVQERFLSVGKRLDYPRVKLSSASSLPAGNHSWTIYAGAHTEDELLSVVSRIEQEAV